MSLKKILITGALGQIGTELTKKYRDRYGIENVVSSNIRMHEGCALECEEPFEVLDVTDYEQFKSVVEKHDIGTVIHLAAILSATGEKNPQLLWDVNMNGLYNCLEIARLYDLKVFVPSSIAAFGPNTPKAKTPQDTLQRPNTIYGVSKVSGELLCDYYYTKYGVDVRGVRYPGLISNTALPGGGTTDYAVHIYYDALRKGSFECNLDRETRMDMMYMPDAVDAVLQLMDADPEKLVHRNAFNITAMSFTPEEIAASIKKYIPTFEITYKVDPEKQAIADSWPDSLDDSCAREEWGFDPEYDLDKMTADMLEKLKAKGV